MCVIMYRHCPGCYGQQNNERLGVERCPRMRERELGHYEPPADQRTPGNICPKPWHYQQSLWAKGKYTTHNHIPGLFKTLPKPRKINAPAPVLEPLEEEEEPTLEEWRECLVKIAFPQEFRSPEQQADQPNYDGNFFSGPPLELFTAQQSGGFMNAEEWSLSERHWEQTATAVHQPPPITLPEATTESRFDNAREMISEAEPTPESSPTLSRPKRRIRCNLKRTYQKCAPKVTSLESYNDGDDDNTIEIRVCETNKSAKRTNQRKPAKLPKDRPAKDITRRRCQSSANKVLRTKRLV